VAGTSTQIGTWSGSSVNALGIAADGTKAYALNRDSSSPSVTAVLKWTPAGGFQTIANSALTISGNVSTSIVAGAVDPSNGSYLFGRFRTGAFDLWRYTEGASTPFAYIGYVATTGSPNGNGDMAFDAKGNLYVLGAATLTSVSSAAIFTVTADSLANPSNGIIASSVTTTQTIKGTDSGNGLTNVNGIAFSPRGTAYLSDASSTYEFDPTTWTRISGTPRVAAASTDLSSCASPATITLQKNVVGRTNGTDQFTLALANGSTTFATATTTGTDTGLQDAQIGPVPTPIGTTLTLSETAASGSLATYTSVYECWADGVRIANGSAARGDVTMPSQLGVAVNCTFFNSTRPVAVVKVGKAIVDPATGASSPKSGWTVGATSTTTTMLPAGQAQQQTDASGSASWTVLFGTASGSGNVTVSEVQQAGYQIVALVCRTTTGSTTTSATVTTTTSTANGVITISGTAANVAAGSTVDCVFTNRPIATLTLVEKVGFGSVAAGAWTITAAGPAAALTGPSGKTGTAVVTSRTVSPGVAYRLSETGGSASYVQVGAWSCVDGDGKAVTVSADGDVNLALGSSVTCTVTNSTAGLTILKNVIDPQAGFEAKNWTITATPNAFTGLSAQSKVGAEYSSAANGNAASTIEVRPGHGYTLTEALTDQTSKVAYQELRLEQLMNGNWVTVNSASITAPAAGQSAVYRFVNAPIPGVVLPLTGGMSTDAFMIAGALILLLALSVAVLHGSRRRRRSTA